MLHLVTKAKWSCQAYEKPTPSTAGRGHPRKKGQSVKLKNLFDQKKTEFETKQVTLYGYDEEVKIYTVNLLLGQGLYQELRFVLIEYKGK